ncbi:recombinase family protein [Streptomyces sp. KPB2]|uniref:recombinase family protein n=1 Tax=unclassified Streptomyces TaxID=2593676 RepID=UPI000F6BEDF1|nr:MULTISPECIES: recombinase family protein [unclassified Streptomyces]AZM79079.1 recombinase family protein [Streptomyces sp. KPB2]MBH5132414.1 recombinase family protein [Streptomyces sp. HB-N217]
MRRVLLLERISDAKGERSESIEAQDEKLRRHAESEGATIAGVAQDVSVSGDVDPFQRKSLGPWLAEENLSKWDELWVSTQDRLSRDDRHVYLFVDWCLKNNKKVIILDDPDFNKNMSTAAGRTMIQVRAMGPAMELERIKIRVAESHERRRFTARWHGGFPPFGFRPVSRFEDGKTAAYLEHCPDMVAVLQEMRRQIIDGQSFLGVSKWLNSNKILTARDRARLRKGKPVKSRKGEGVQERWSETTVKSVLTNESTQGLKKYQGKLLYDPEGAPVRLAEPIFTDDEWTSLQAAIQQRTMTKAKRVNRTNPLYGVTFCGICGAKAVQKSHTRGDRTWRYYICGSFPKEDRCKGSVNAYELEEWLEVLFLQRWFHEPVTEKVWVPGTDHSRELEDVRKRIVRLRDNYESGAYDDDPEGYKSRLHALRTRRDELSAEPVVEGHWSEVPTGKTYGELWPTLDEEGRRKQLVRSGFRVELSNGTFEVTDPVPETPEERRARGIRLGTWAGE